MIENKELGLKIAENSDEVFWTELKEKCLDATKAEERNLKINSHMLKLCAEELSKYVKS